MHSWDLTLWCSCNFLLNKWQSVKTVAKENVQEYNTKTFKAIFSKWPPAVINFKRLQLLQFLDYNLHLCTILNNKLWGFQTETHVKTPKMEVKTDFVGEVHIYPLPTKGRLVILMSPPCLESEGWKFDPTFFISSLLFSSSAALSVLSFSAFGPFTWPLSLNLHFLKGRLFVWLVFFFFLEQWGDEYFSWWYVQHMLTYGTGISLYAFI